jgi:hypothetical protein
MLSPSDTCDMDASRQAAALQEVVQGKGHHKKNRAAAEILNTAHGSRSYKERGFVQAAVG